jgi:hypothetical protein
MLVEFIWGTVEITLLFEQTVHRTAFGMLNNIFIDEEIGYIYTFK